MASRSMNFMRKYAKVILAIMGVVCMITFVVGPYLLDLLMGSPNQPRGKDPIAVTWTKGKVHESELGRLRFQHRVVSQFLASIIQETLNRGGTPVVGGQQLRRDQPISNIGIPLEDSDVSAFETMLMAAEADRMGIVVDQAAAKEFVRQISAPELGESDWLEIANMVLGDSGHMTVGQIFDHLAYELKAQHVRMLARAGLLAIPPGELWQYFNRLNRRVTIEAYPVEVAPLVQQVKAEPTEAELRALFDEGKFRDPNPNVKEPGFRKPHRVAFGFVRVDFTPFLEEAKKKITDEQVAEQYHKDISQGMHKILELPGIKPPEGDKPADDNKPADQPGAAPADAKPAADKPEEKPAESPAADKPAAAEKPAESKGSEPQPSAPAEKPAEKAADPSADAKPAAEPAASAPEKSAPAEKKSDSGNGGADGCAFDEQANENQPPAAEPKSTEPKAETPKATEAKGEAQPAETKADAAKSEPVKSEPTESEPTKSEPAKTEPAKPAGETKPAADSKPAAPAEPPAPAPEPKFKPLSEVQGEIRTRLAQPLAQEAKNKAVKEVTDAINSFGRRYRRWVSVKDFKKGNIEDPGKLDLSALAARFGFETGTTPLVDRFQVGEYEIGRNVMQFDIEALRRGESNLMRSFADLAFQEDDILYEAREASSVVPDVTYLYYRTAEEKPADVTFDEVRKQVVEAWRKQRAFELAMADAKKLAEKAAGANSLGEAVGDPTRVIQPPAFSWMTTGALAMGFGQPELSRVTGIDLPGEEFMAAVFALKQGETGVAPNQPHSKVYVVRLLGQEPSDEVLRERFLESGLNMQVIAIAQRDRQQYIYDWYRQLEKKYQVSWQRPPYATSRGEL